ncbi:MAG: carboxylesterase family protein, partial [Actinocatenispora sp.]
PRPWSGVRDATRPGARCAQTADPVAGTAGSTSEDCLYLNVTAPTHPGRGRLPVLVWLHGGGLKTGAGSDVEPRRLATRGRVVVVTVNYRLGVFGFFGHADLPGSGTFGLLDQQAALRWVRSNAAAFGGDAGNVSVIGESGGGDSACAQLASPAARGLFDRAIIQSGTCSDANPVDALIPGAGAAVSSWTRRSTVNAAGDRTAAALGCGPGDVLRCLRSVPTTRLLSDRTVNSVYWSPAYRTPVLPERPAEAIRHGHVAPVPVLAGTTRDEATFLVDAAFTHAGNPITTAYYGQLLDRAFGDDADRVAAAYPPRRFGSPGRAWAAIVTDRGYVCPNLDTERILSRWTSVHGYEFADRHAPLTFHVTPSFPYGAYHGSDVQYLWDRPGAATALRPGQRRLADTMIGYVARFARTGDPNGGAAPYWPGAGHGLVESLAPGAGGVRPADIRGAHHCALWPDVQHGR